MQAFIEQATAKYGDRFDYSRAVWSGPRGKLTIGCILHDAEFEQIAAAFLKQPGCKQCTDAQKTEEFIVKSRAKHGDRYTYNDAKYVNTDVKVIIGCKIHGIFYQTPYKHLRGQGCAKCGVIQRVDKRRATRDEFIQKSQNVHGKTKYDYTHVVYVDSNTKVLIICNIHGQFEQAPSNHLSGQGCAECGCKKQYTNESFIQRAQEVHNHMYVYDEIDYINNNTKITIICPSHGPFKQTPNDHLCGYGCKKCGSESTAEKLRGNTGGFIQKALLVHKNKYDYSQVNYVCAKTKILISCPTHGVFEQSPNDHLNGSGCTNCKHKTESKLLEWLQVEFDPSNVESQVQFETCKKESTGRRYIYDFRVGNSIVEIDGLQHFTTVRLFKNCPEESLINDTHKAYLLTVSPKGPNLNLIRVYQPWVAADSNNWQEQLLNAIISLEHLRGQVVYIGGDVYDRHRAAYDEFITQHAAGQVV